MKCKVTIPVTYTVEVEVNGETPTDEVRKMARKSLDQYLLLTVLPPEYSRDISEWEVNCLGNEPEKPTVWGVIKLIPQAILMVIGILLISFWPMLVVFLLAQYTNLIWNIPLPERLWVIIVPVMGWFFGLIMFVNYRDMKSSQKYHEDRQKRINDILAN